MWLPVPSGRFGGILVVGPDFRERRGKFFAQVYGRHQGYLCIARKKVGQHSLLEKYFQYPDELDQALDFIDEFVPQFDMYFCAQLLAQKQRRKENIKEVALLWADLDPCPPDVLRVKPTIVWQTSEDRTQAIWRLEQAVDAYDAEMLSHRIAYWHKDDGVDQSGWDLTQLLRVPFTFNFKYGPPHPQIYITDARPGHYRPEDFAAYEPIPGEVQLNGSPLPSVTTTGAQALGANRHLLPDFVVALFNTVPDESQKEGWSGALWSLIMECIERGLSVEDTFVIARDAACNKYERDGRPAEALWKDIRKAHARVAAHTQALIATIPKPSEILDPDYKQPDSFVEHYITWARQQTDAPAVYHQAGAFMVLSTSLCGMIVLPTSDKRRGETLNLWFMILADSTVTRKSTTMNMATDLLEEIVPDAVATNEATIEGLWAVMSARAGKPSIFKRDEISGMLDMMQKKEYYAGMAEQLAQLYDGTSLSRQLARSTITIKDPRLVMFVGGAKSKTMELLDESFVRSGFLPRFLFFSGVADINNLRPLGPPTEDADEARDQIVEELRKIVGKYQGMTSRIVGLSTLPATQKVWKAQLTPEAWARYRLLDETMIKDAANSKEDELVMPMYQRLAKSILKTAVLLAACRPENPEDNKVVVTEDDIEHAISYGIDWRGAAIEILASVNASPYESQVKRVIGYMHDKQAHGVNRKALMRMFKLKAYEADQLFATLEGRGLIRQSRAGKEIIYFPTGV